MFKKLTNYFYQVAEEFKKIKYPEKKEIITMSIGVLVAIFVVGLFCLSIDWLFITFINWAIL